MRTKFNNYLRFEVFGAKIREVAILTVAREMDCQFEWAAHEPEALKEGVPAEVIDVIKRRLSTQGIDETYAAIIELGRQAFGDHKVTPQAFARIKKLIAAGQARRARAADGQLRVHRRPAHGIRHASAGRQAAASGAVRHSLVSRAQRSTRWCAADPGS